MPKPARSLQLATPPRGSWVQTERAAHEAWAKLSVSHPKAAALLHLLVSKLGRGNAVVASQATLAALLGCTDRTVRRSLTVLKEQNWIEVHQVGATQSSLAYIVNSRVAWHGSRDGIRHAAFSATVILSSNEQPNAADLDNQTPLMRLPRMKPGEQQLPLGPGLPPPSQPHLDGLEPDLPTPIEGDEAQT